MDGTPPNSQWLAGRRCTTWMVHLLYKSPGREPPSSTPGFLVLLILLVFALLIFLALALLRLGLQDRLGIIYEAADRT